MKKIRVNQTEHDKYEQTIRGLNIRLQLNHPLFMKYLDNWQVMNGDNIQEIYYTTENQGYVSLNQLIKSLTCGFKNKLRRHSPLSFKLFQKLAFELLSALVVLKQYSLVHGRLANIFSNRRIRPGTPQLRGFLEVGIFLIFSPEQGYFIVLGLLLG